MQPSECCIIRASIAASLGAVTAFVLLLSQGLWIAAMLSPFFGSAAAVGAVALFWVVSRFVPCDAHDRPAVEAAR